MKTLYSNPGLRIGLFAAALLSAGATAWSADTPTLKEVYKDHFYIGAAVNRTIATSTAVRADNVNRTLEEVQNDIALVKAQFNQIVPENDLKWALVHPRQGADGYDFAPADAFVKFGEDNGMYLVGHTLVWHSQTPSWVFQAAASATPAAATPDAATPDAAPAARRGGGRAGRGISGPPATREELLERMRDHIHTVVGRYKGKIKAWDVVNEAIADGGSQVLRDSPWTQIIGDDFIAKAFQYAHEADPDCILRYNDYGLENQGKRDKLKKLIKSLQDQGVPVMAIGTQTHVSASSPSFEQMDAILTDLETLGLPIHVTELDVDSGQGGRRRSGANVADNAATTQGGVVSAADQRLADAYAGLFRAFVKHKEHVKVVTFWGANDAVSWRASGRPLLFDGNDQPKPAFDAVIRVVTGE